MICILCHDNEAVSAKRCQACKNAIASGTSARGKWAVAIQTCEKSHRYVPIKKVEGCVICHRDNEKTNLFSMQEASDSEDSSILKILL